MTTLTLPRQLRPVAKLMAPRRCHKCGLLIFHDQAEAQRAGVQFSAGCNQAIVGKEITMTRNGGIPFLAFEETCDPPPKRRTRKDSKYDLIGEKIMAIPLDGDGRSGWCRFKITDEEALKRTASYLSRLRVKIQKQGLTLKQSRRLNSDGTYWLYVRKLTYPSANGQNGDNS